jgi:hypothetical protein
MEQSVRPFSVVSVQLLEGSPHDNGAPVVPALDFFDLETDARVLPHHSQLHALDLDVRDRADLADDFEGSYVQLAYDDDTLPHLLRFYRCYRAIVRGKVETIATHEPQIERSQAAEAHERAIRHFALAQRYASEELPQTLVILGGLSGIGTSHLAATLAARIGAVLVRSDIVRKEMPEASGAPSEATYSREERAQVYEVARDRCVRTWKLAGRLSSTPLTSNVGSETPRDGWPTSSVSLPCSRGSKPPRTPCGPGSRRATPHEMHSPMHGGTRTSRSGSGWIC